MMVVKIELFKWPQTFRLLSATALSLAPPWFSNLALAQTASSKPSAKSSRPAAADLPLIDLAGYNQVLAKYHGKPLVVTFWATWCAPCRDEFPLLVELQKQYAPQGLAIFV